MAEAVEMVRVLTDDGEPTGDYLTKPEILERGLRRPVTHVWLLNQFGETLIGTRTQTVPRWPGQKDVAVGEGVIGDETYKQAAVRGLFEELGLIAMEADLVFLGENKLEHDLPSGKITREYDNTFGYRFDGEARDIKVDGIEIERVEWVPLGGLADIILNPETYQAYLDHGVEYYRDTMMQITSSWDQLR